MQHTFSSIAAKQSPLVGIIILGENKGYFPTEPKGTLFAAHHWERWWYQGYKMEVLVGSPHMDHMASQK